MLKYWLWLCLCKGIGPRMALNVLRFFGTPEKAYYADEAEYALVPELTKVQIKGYSFICIEEIIAVSTRKTN